MRFYHHRLFHGPRCRLFDHCYKVKKVHLLTCALAIEDTGKLSIGYSPKYAVHVQTSGNWWFSELVVGGTVNVLCLFNLLHKQRREQYRRTPFLTVTSFFLVSGTADSSVGSLIQPPCCWVLVTLIKCAVMHYNQFSTNLMETQLINGSRCSSH